jgi:hypothetical protein
MPVDAPETRQSAARGLQYSLGDLFLYFLSITILVSGYTTVFSGEKSGWSYNLFFFLIYVLPVIVGCLLYLIGTSIRWRMHYPRFPPVTRYLLILFLLISSVSLCYLLWAYKRTIYGECFISGPREWPYPDKVLLELNNWYDIRYPASPNSFKIHGEIPRVIITIEIFIGSFFVIVAWCLGLLLPFRLEWLDELKSICKRCLMRR